MTAREFEDGIAATNLLPGPASTQLAIFCAWRLRGTLGAVVGGLCFIVPGLVIILVPRRGVPGRPPAAVDRGCRRRGGRGRAGGGPPGRRRVGPGQLARGPGRAVRPASGGSPTWWSGRRRRPRSDPGWSLVLAGLRARRGRVVRVAAGPATAGRRAIPACPRRWSSRRRRRGPGCGGLGGVQGGGALLRRRVRDHPAHAARRRPHLSLDDGHPVPRCRRARPDHTRAGGPDGRRRRLRRGRGARRAAGGARGVRPVVPLRHRRGRALRPAAAQPLRPGVPDRGRRRRHRGHRRFRRSPWGSRSATCGSWASWCWPPSGSWSSSGRP